MLGPDPLRAALLPALLASTLLASCLAMRTPTANEAIALGPKEALVLGRVRVFESGRELHPWALETVEVLLADPELKLSLFRIESGRKRPYVPLDADGGFTWIVPEGTYLIYHTPSIEPPVNEPLAAFQVRAGPEPVDLGELVLEVTVERAALGDASAYSVVGTSADRRMPEAALSQLSAYPGARTIQSGALIVDPQLYGLFADWSREACARVLARHDIALLAK